nr:MAG TPA: hypothetical protein [Caudoviricetes sp.]
MILASKTTLKFLRIWDKKCRKSFTRRKCPNIL